MRPFLSNLGIVIRAATFRPFDVVALQPTPAQIMLAVALDIAAFAGLEWWFTGPIAGLSVYGISALFAATFVTFAALTVASVLTRRSNLLAPMLFGVPLLAVASYALLLGLSFVKPAGMTGQVALAIASFAVLIIPTAVFVIRLYTKDTPRAVWRGIFASLALFGAQFGALAVLPVEPLWDHDYGETEDYANYVPPDVERIYYAQPNLLAAQTATMRPGDPDRIEVFALVIGGTAEQNVFLHEAESVRDTITDIYAARDRTITLVNSRESPDRYPLANAPNIRTALSSLATEMNADQDILVIYMTSHGAPDLFSLTFYEFGTEDLTASTLAQLIDDSGIRTTAILLSACKSGSFIDDLAGPDRLVMTSASASRNSFGCGDNRDWTWWGEALFANALQQTPDLRAAFDISKTLIETWEIRDNQISSDPQISLGAGFDLTMDAYLAQAESIPTD